MRNTFRNILFALSLITMLCHEGMAAEYTFHSLGVRQGLSSSTVNTMLVDSRGMLWIGTSMGLNRYDGYEVRQFRYFDKEEKLPAASIGKLSEDARGNIWIDYNGDIARYDIASQAFYTDSREYFKSLGIHLPAKYQFSTDDYGNLWFISDGQILYYNYATGHTNQWKVNLKLGTTAWEFAHCGEGIYLCDGSRVWRFIGKNGLLQKISLPANMQTIAGHMRLYVDSENTLWVYSTVSEDIYHHGGAQVTLPKGVPSNAIRDIFDDGKGNIWIATDHNGVFICKRGDATPTHLTHLGVMLGSIASDNVTCITADKQGTIYLGHFKTGISIANTGSALFANSGQHMGDISTIYYDRHGNLWLGTDGNGAYIIKAGQEAEEKLQMPDITISSFLEDHAGNVWVGTYNDGLYRMHGNSVDRVFTSKDGTLPCNAAWQIAEDNHHNVWVASGFGSLYRFSTDTEKATVVKVNGQTVNGLSLAFDGKHTMYVGTYYGIWAYDTNTGKAVCLLGNRKGTQKLLQPSVVSLTYDNMRNALWVAHTTGVSVLDTKRDSLFFFNEHNGLFDTYVKSIVEDKQGNMWLSTGRGISCIQAQKGGGYVVHNFNDRIGVQNTYFNTFAATCSPDGEVLMGGNEGLTVISPVVMYAGRIPPTLSLTEVTVGSTHTTHHFSDNSLRFSYDDRQITLHFFTGDLSSNGRVLYAYRINGLTDEWTYTLSNKIEFFSLPHGSYTLEIKATDENGEWGEPLTIKIRVTPPFYLSWWMMLIYALLAIAAAFGAYRVLRSRHRRRIEEQRLLMEQGQQAQLSEMKLRFFTNISHDLRTPLTLIISPLQSMIEEMRKDDSQSALRKRLEMIYKNARLLFNQVNMLLDFRRLDVGAETLHTQSIDVAQYVGNICLSFHDFAKDRDISLEYTPSAEHVFFVVDAEKLNKIMYNLLSNAFKFTPDGGKVVVKLSTVDSKLHISVADTGCGVADADKEHIFQRFYQVRNDDPKAGSGIGLHIVNEYVNMHGGTITVADNEPQGTIFTIDLPQNSEKSEQSDNPELTNHSDNPEYSDYTEQTDTPDNDATERTTTILVVDDNHDLCTFIADSLLSAYADKHYNVLTAADGEEALEQLNKNDVTLVVTDIMMPKIDGMELCRRIKTNIAWSHIPVIMLTAKQTDQDIIGGLKLGADDYITKPFNIEHLTLRIDKFIEWNTMSHENFQKKIEVNPSEITITSLDEEFVSKAIKLVEDHMSDSDYSVETFSSDLNMSRANLYKKMMSITGMGPHEFMRSLRLKRAHQLLERSQKQVSEIAYAVGYSSPKRFSENFKAEYGMTPSEFAKKCNQ